MLDILGIDGRQACETRSVTTSWILSVWPISDRVTSGRSVDCFIGAGSPPRPNRRAPRPACSRRTAKGQAARADRGTRNRRKGDRARTVSCSATAISRSIRGSTSIDDAKHRSPRSKRVSTRCDSRSRIPQTDRPMARPTGNSMDRSQSFESPSQSNRRHLRTP